MALPSRMSTAINVDVFHLFILVTVLHAHFPVSNARNLTKIEVSVQREPANFSLSDFIDTRSNNVIEAILQVKHTLVMEKSSLLTSLPEEELEYNFRRTLHGTLGTLKNCSFDLSVVVGAANMRVRWAQDMIDATGKPGYGFLLHNVSHIGNFDECMDVETDVDFEGRYCTTNILVSKIEQRNINPPLRTSLGLCVPSSCDGIDVEYLINEYFQRFEVIVARAVQTHCQDRHLELSTKAKIVIGICSIFVTVLVVATMYDAFYKRWWLELKKNQYNNQDKDEANDATLSINKESYSEHEPIIDPEMQHTKLYTQNEEAPTKKAKNLELLDQFLMSFSVYTNTAKLFSTNQPQGNIGCINGMRFLSLAWIILIHQIPYSLATIGNIREYLKDAHDRWTFMAISKADTGVDTFFAMGGLLMTYLVLKELHQRQVTARFFANFYIHRVWRLMPPCMLILMTYVPLIKYAGKGPFWPQGGFEKNECKDTWWITMFYLNNFIKAGDDACMGWTWYLSCDMQFYIISPLMFLPMLYYGWKGLLSPFVFLLANAICGGVISSVNDLVAVQGLDTLLDGPKDDFFTYYYIKPYTRIGPYIIGMITGFLLFKSEMKARLSKSVVILGWTIATATALAVVYGLQGHVWQDHLQSTDVRALYNALSRIAWGMSVCWVIFACANGYGGFVNTLLSWKAFIPLSRLSYCAYLVHPIVIQYLTYTRGNLYHIDDVHLASFFVATLVITHLVAYVASMAYEVPMTGLEKMVKGQARRKT